MLDDDDHDDEHDGRHGADEQRPTAVPEQRDRIEGAITTNTAVS